MLPALAPELSPHFQGRIASNWRARGLHGCWKGVCRSNLYTDRVRFFLCTLRAKDIAFRYSYLRPRRLREMQYLAHSCTKKVLFSRDELGLGRELLADAKAGR